jgi:hypothetical protein
MESNIDIGELDSQPYKSNVSSQRTSGDLLIEYPDSHKMMEEHRLEIPGELTEM